MVRKLTSGIFFIGVISALILAGCSYDASNIKGNAAKFILNEDVGPESLYISMPEEYMDADIGDTIVLEVKLNEVTDIYSVGYDVLYDTDYLEYLWTEEGPFLASDDTGVTFQQPTEENPGIIKGLGLSRQGDSGGISGSGVVATMGFKVKSKGYSEVNLENVKAYDYDLNTITLNVVDGNVYIYEPCVDEDLDGYGKDCPSGDDCDDSSSYVNPGAAEICDKIDNNCDGKIDEGCECTDGDIQQCGSDVGVCEKGTQLCVDGKWSECSDSVISTEEICDGLDNDCDGKIDEGLSMPCSELYKGICAEGTQTCSDGKWEGCPAPKEEICGNDIDDDCDGNIDEGCSGCTAGEERPCGDLETGACSLGVQTCDANGTWGDCIGAIDAVPELCNNIDDNCNGEIDEGLSMPCSELYKGICAEGTQTCSDGKWECPAPKEEICGNDIDEDCNGYAEPCNEEGLSMAICADTQYGDWDDNRCKKDGCHEGYMLAGCQRNQDGQRREVCVKIEKTSCVKSPSCNQDATIIRTISCDMYEYANNNQQYSQENQERAQKFISRFLR